MQLKWNVLRSASLFAIVVVLTSVSPQISAQQPKTQTLTGVVSDTTCGATHTMKNMSAADCTRMCAKQGAYALVVGANVYSLQGHAAELEKLAGERVTLKGAIKDKTVTVASVTLAPKG